MEEGQRCISNVRKYGVAKKQNIALVEKTNKTLRTMQWNETKNDQISYIWSVRSSNLQMFRSK